MRLSAKSFLINQSLIASSLFLFRYHAAPALDTHTRVYDIPGNHYEECEEIEDASGYLDVVSNISENNCYENGDLYEEIP